MTDNSKKSTRNNKKEDGKFHSKHINHNPQAESARAVFGKKEGNFQNNVDSNLSENKK